MSNDVMKLRRLEMKHEKELRNQAVAADVAKHIFTNPMIETIIGFAIIDILQDSRPFPGMGKLWNGPQGELMKILLGGILTAQQMAPIAQDLANAFATIKGGLPMANPINWSPGTGNA